VWLYKHIFAQMPNLKVLKKKIPVLLASMMVGEAFYYCFWTLLLRSINDIQQNPRRTRTFTDHGRMNSYKFISPSFLYLLLLTGVDITGQALTFYKTTI
jgi:hypothetical protein